MNFLCVKQSFFFSKMSLIYILLPFLFTSHASAQSMFETTQQRNKRISEKLSFAKNSYAMRAARSIERTLKRDELASGKKLRSCRESALMHPMTQGGGVQTLYSGDATGGRAEKLSATPATTTRAFLGKRRLTAVTSGTL